MPSKRNISAKSKSSKDSKKPTVSSRAQRLARHYSLPQDRPQRLSESNDAKKRDLLNYLRRTNVSTRTMPSVFASTTMPAVNTTRKNIIPNQTLFNQRVISRGDIFNSSKKVRGLEQANRERILNRERMYRFLDVAEKKRKGFPTAVKRLILAYLKGTDNVQQPKTYQPLR